MSYGDESLKWWTFSTTAADSLAATGDAAETFKVAYPITVTRVGFIVSTLVDGAPVVKFDKRPNVGSDTDRGDGDVGELTVPDTTAVGVMVTRDVTPVDLEPGDEVVPQVTSAATAGAGFPVVFYRIRQEEPGNIDSWVAVTS